VRFSGINTRLVRARHTTSASVRCFEVGRRRDKMQGGDINARFAPINRMGIGGGGEATLAPK